MKRSSKERIARDERDSYRRSEMEFGVAADAYRSDPSRKATRNGAVMVTVVLALAAFLAVLALWYAVAGGLSLVGIAVALIVGLGVLSSVHVCLEWERAVIMRLGRFNRLAGPGIFFSIPLIEFSTLRVDQRTTATPFGAEEALTSDLVPLDVDAVLFWMIWDAREGLHGGGGLPLRRGADRPDGAARRHRSRVGVQRGRCGATSLTRSCRRRWRRRSPIGASRCSRWRSATSSSRRSLQGVMSLEAQAECREERAHHAHAEAERDVSAMLAGGRGNLLPRAR